MRNAKIKRRKERAASANKFQNLLNLGSGRGRLETHGKGNSRTYTLTIRQPHRGTTITFHQVDARALAIVKSRRGKKLKIKPDEPGKVTITK